jgi:hypothetical protein
MQIFKGSITTAEFEESQPKGVRGISYTKKYPTDNARPIDSHHFSCDIINVDIVIVNYTIQYSKKRSFDGSLAYDSSVGS